MQPMTFAPGSTIFRTGDPSVAVYVIEEGAVTISVGDGADAIEVACLGPGALFGESGVLEARPRAATATAVARTSLLVTDAETFIHAFGMENDRALALVRLLCARLRGTNLRAAQAHAGETEPAPAHSAIRLVPAHERLTGEFGLKPVDVRSLPFQVGNRFGGETVPLAAHRGLAIPAHGEVQLAAPHFEILRRDGLLGVRDLGSRDGTIVNGILLNRASVDPVVALHMGENTVIAGRPHSPFRFQVAVRPL
jgi:CRP-like cAMP-binding protein